MMLLIIGSLLHGICNASVTVTACGRIYEYGTGAFGNQLDEDYNFIGLIDQRRIVTYFTTGDTLTVAELDSLGLTAVVQLRPGIAQSVYIYPDDHSDPESNLALIEDLPNVTLAYYDALFPISPSPPENDPLFGDNWALGGIADTSLSALTTWELAAAENPPITVAILSEGVDWLHPDLFDNIWQNLGEDHDSDGTVFEYYAPPEYLYASWGFDSGDVGYPPEDDDGNGYKDDFIGWDFTAADIQNQNNPVDSTGFGTAAAGIIAAVGNDSVGTVGLAAGASGGPSAKIMVLKVIYEGPEGYPVVSLDGVADAIVYAANNGARVISISFGLYHADSLGFHDDQGRIQLHEEYEHINSAIDFATFEKGCVVVCPAGDASSAYVQYPANLYATIAVGVSTQDRSTWPDNPPYTPGSASGIDMIAPGVAIPTLDAHGAMGFFSGDYVLVTGAEFASQFASAAAALMLQAEPSLTAMEVREIMLETAEKRLPGLSVVPQPKYGYGRLDPAGALAAVRFNAELAESVYSADANLPSGSYENLMVVGDAVVESGVVVSIEEGTTVYVLADHDRRNFGGSVNQAEVIVEGGLILSGGAGANVDLTSTAEGGPGDWGGIYARGGSLDLQSANISYADWAIQANSGASLDLVDVNVTNCNQGILATHASMALDGCAISASGIGLYLTEASYADVDSSILVSGGTGIEVLDESSLSFSNSGCDAGHDGIFIEESYAAVVSGSTVSGNAVGWSGIAVADGGELLMHSGVTVEDSETGIYVYGDSSHADIWGGTVQNCDYGVWASNEAIVNITDLQSTDFPVLTIDNTTYVALATESTGSCLFDRVEVTGGSESNWIGIETLPGSLTDIRRCQVSDATGNNAIGVKAEGETTLEGILISSVSGQTASGVYVDSDSSTAVEIGTADTLGGLWVDSQILDCYYGLRVVGTSRPRVRHVTLGDHVKCVEIGPAALPDLGKDWDHGDNRILSGSSKLASAKPPRVAGLPIVPASYNWWGSDPPDSTKITWATIDISPWQHSDPYTPMAKEVEVERVAPPVLTLRAYPNPTTGPVTLEFTLPGTTATSIELIDIQGRVVRTFSLGTLGEGTHTSLWDGRTNAGLRAPAGVYFASLRLGTTRKTMRIILSH